MIRFRNGTTADANAVLDLMDANVAWLVEQGREAQWGSEPWSASPDKSEFVRGMVCSGTLTIVESDGATIAASLLADHPMPYVPELVESEYYLKLLVVSPKHRGEQIGHRLIELARQQTLEDGVDLLRVDCWSGGDRRLVDYYVSQGFVPTEEIEVRAGVSVQVFEWRADPQA